MAIGDVKYYYDECIHSMKNKNGRGNSYLEAVAEAVMTNFYEIVRFAVTDVVVVFDFDRREDYSDVNNC